MTERYRQEDGRTPDRVELEAQIARLRGLLRAGSDGPPGVPLADIPFGYERAIDELERRGEVTSRWIHQRDNGIWTTYVVPRQRGGRR